jgi:hypothetical protein
MQNNIGIEVDTVNGGIYLRRRLTRLSVSSHARELEEAVYYTERIS